MLSSDEALLEVVTELIELERRLLQVLTTVANQPRSSTITRESARDKKVHHCCPIRDK
jgi:hypothetical protein